MQSQSQWTRLPSINPRKCSPSISKGGSKKVKTQQSFTSNLSPYEVIQQVPTVHLSNEQMRSDPILLLQNLESLSQQYAKYGAVRLVISRDWQPPFCLRTIGRGITTRIQELQKLHGGIFRYPYFLYTYNQLELSLSHSNKKYKAIRFQPIVRRQFHFRTNMPLRPILWGHVNQPDESMNTGILFLVQNVFCLLLAIVREDDRYKTTVEYAADLPSMQYGSGFPRSASTKTVDDNFVYHENPYNLNYLSESPYSLLKIASRRHEEISGITIPWVYLGMQFATFCWHVEDFWMNSLNYSHEGAIKTWYIVPSTHKTAFDEFVLSKLPAKDNQKYPKNKKNEKIALILHRITTMIDPLELRAHGIPVYKVHQQPGNYVCTFKKAYHCGFSHGFNIGQAVNFASMESLSTIQDAITSYRATQGVKTSIFPMQWLIRENYTACLQSNCFSNQLKTQLGIKYREMLSEEHKILKQLLSSLPICEASQYPSQTKYSAYICGLCKEYCYMHVLRCLNCNGYLCDRHGKPICPMKKCQASTQQKYGLLYREPLNADRSAIQNIIATLLPPLSLCPKFIINVDALPASPADRVLRRSRDLTHSCSLKKTG